MRPQLMALLIFATMPEAITEAQVRHGATTAADLALAGATRTLDGEAVALFANPAGLEGVGSQLLFGLGLQGARARYTDDALQSRDLAAPHPMGYAVTTLSFWRHRLVAALAYRRRIPAFARHAPAADENNASMLRFLGRRTSWDEHEVSVGLATSLRWVAFGASFSASRVTLTFERTLFAGTADDLHFLGTRHLDVDLQTDLDGYALAGRAGVILSPWWWLRAALTLDLPQRLRLGGDVTFDEPPLRPSTVANLELQGGNAEASLDAPWRLGGGLALHLTRTLRVFVELDLLMGGQSHSLVLRKTRWFADGQEVAIRTLDLLPKPETTASWRFALELALWGDLLRLRGGWALTQGSYGATGLGALLFDVQRHELGAGLVLHAERVQLSLGVKHMFAAELKLPTDGSPVVAPLHEGAPTTTPAGAIEFSRTQIALEVAVAL